jgi:hypothetical protein
MGVGWGAYKKSLQGVLERDREEMRQRISCAMKGRHAWRLRRFF